MSVTPSFLTRLEAAAYRQFSCEERSSLGVGAELCGSLRPHGLWLLRLLRVGISLVGNPTPVDGVPSPWGRKQVRGRGDMRHVLVVEDDPAIGELISDALLDKGWSVECVKTDLEAYKRIPGLPTLDGLVLDINLGRGTTGYDIARFARQVIPQVAVVYVSGEMTRASFQAFGVPQSVFVEKPFTPDQLESALSRLMCACE